MKTTPSTITRIFLAIAVVAGLTQCADTYTWVDDTEPRVYLNNTPTLFEKTDSVKVSLKNAPTFAINPIAFTLTANISENLQLIKIEPVSGGGSLLAEGADVTAGASIRLNASKTSLAMVFNADRSKEVTYRMVFTCRDLGGSVGRQTVYNVVAFKNLPPVAKLTITKKANDVWIFNTTGSYDQDAKWGGMIKTYNFTVTGPGSETRLFDIDAPLTTYEYGFSQPGNYTVKLKVTDNDEGTAESAVSPTITVTN